MTREEALKGIKDDIYPKDKAKKNLLVISPEYSTFVKDQTEIISSHFKHIDVLVRYNPIAEISNFLPIDYLKPFRKKALLSLTNKSKNISVIVTPIFYLPTELGYKNLGDKHFKVVDKVIRKNNWEFDLIHAHHTWSAGYVGAKLKGKYDVPFIVTAHGYDIYDLPFRDDEWKEKIKYVLNAADYIITVSNSNLECIKKLNVKTPVRVIPNGFRADLFCPRDLAECRKILDLPSDKTIILTVGNLEEIKGHKFLIDAMNEVVKHKKDVLCVIVGSGKLKGKLKQQIRKTGLEDYVTLAGGKPHDKIPLWMNACDVFVLPSLRESFGIVQIEAMACGKPVVATYNGGSEEIITSEELGYLVEPANPKELAEKILIGLDKEWDDEKIRKYAEQFRIENKVKEVLEVYKHII